jgi:hypothetical protein
MGNVGDRRSAVRVTVLEPAEDLADQLVAASRNRCYLDCRVGWGVPMILDSASHLRGSVHGRAASAVQPAVQG